MFAELRGAGLNPRVGREEALSVPTVQRGRNLLCSIATLPLEQLDPKNNVVRNPLLEQIDPDVPNVVTMAQTIEDLVFESIAWWRVTLIGFDGYPVNARRIDPCTVSLEPPAGYYPSPLPAGEDPRGAVVYINGEEVSASEVIRFDSPNPAVLKVGGRAIKRALLLDQAARMYAEDPRALEYFTQDPEAEQMSDDEIKEFLTQWEFERRKRAAAYVPPGMNRNEGNSPTPADLQLVQLQAQAALDIANAFGLDPEELGVSTTSRTYSNVNDRRRDKINDVLSPYMRAITDRLSMGDVTKRGYRVVFDLNDYLKANAAERWANYEKAKNLGVMTVDEIRAAEGLPPLSAPANPAPANGTQASADTSMDFDADSKLQFVDVPVEQFSVDAGKRTIEGLALPYGVTASKGGTSFRFQKGSLQWSDVSRVKLLRDHNMTQPIGVATELNDTPQGLKVKFKVARGQEGDTALQMAEDGVLDGLSVGVDFNASADTAPDPQNRDGVLVRRGDLREVSLTAMPAFDSARVTKVAASRSEVTMTESVNGQTPEAGQATTPTEAPAVTLSADQFAELLKFAGQNVPAPRQSPENAPADEGDQRQVVNPTRLTASTSVNEALPYQFDRGGNFQATENVFSADLRDMQLSGDLYGNGTDAGKRVMGLLSATFAVSSGNVSTVNPTIQRPDLYVDQRDYMYPLWNAINKGTPPNGVQPFAFPKFNTASGLVGDHTEGTEPASGAFTTTNQTVTPTPLSGKASITREVWDMGGNPAVSTLIFNQMVRGYREGLESATATFLNTLTAATDINLGVAVVDDALADAWEQALAGLAFTRGYDFSVFAIEQVLYQKFVACEDTTGRPLFPILNPTNANGSSDVRFRQLNLSGVVGTPSWALASTAGSPNNSWLFDPTTVHGWATTPQRLEFAGTTAAGAYGPVAMVDIAIWGYKALANSDIAGVRQVIYDSV